MKKKTTAAILSLAFIVSAAFFGAQNAFAANDFIRGGKPAASVSSGAYDEVQEVELSASGGGVIYYTLDGSVPTVSNTGAVLYAEPIIVGTQYKNSETVLKAVQYRAGDGLYSEVAVFNYIINGERNMLSGVIPYLEEGAAFEGIEGDQPYEDIEFLKQTTDGVFANWNGITTDSEWVTWDMGAKYPINRIIFAAYNNIPNIYNLNIQLAEDEDFTQGVYKALFTSADNYSPSNYAPGPGQYAYKIDFAPVTARYVRSRNTSWVPAEHNYGNRVCEMQAFAGTEVPANRNMLFGVTPYLEDGADYGNIEGAPAGGTESDLMSTTNGIFGNWQGINTDSEWVTWDMGAPYPINRIIFSAYPVAWTSIFNLNIQLAEDKGFTQGVYNAVSTSDGNSRPVNYAPEPGKTAFKIDFAPVTARFIRSRNNSNAPGAGNNRVCEIQAFYGTAVNPDSNIALYKPVVIEGGTDYTCAEDGTTALPEHFENVTNGSITNFGLSTGSDSSWITVDLGTEYTINKIMMSAYPSWPTIGNIRIQTSLTSNFAAPETIHWQDVSDPMMNSNYTEAAGKYGFVFEFEPIEARYIRIANSANSGAFPYVTLLSELQAFTAAPSVPAPGPGKVLSPVSERQIDVFNVTTLTEILAELGDEFTVYDNDGGSYTANVSWAHNFAAGTAGIYTFNGELSNLPAGILNLYDIEAAVKVTVLPALNFSGLIGKITAYGDLDYEDYSASSWSALGAKMSEAQASLSNPRQYQSDVDTLTGELEAAYQNLVDISALAAKAAQAGAINASDYTSASAAELDGAISIAELVLGNSFCTKTQVADALALLQDAINGLTAKADKTALNALLVYYSDVDPQYYTVTSYQRLAGEIERLELLIADPDASQAEADGLEQDLESAYSALVAAADKGALQSKIAEAEGLNQANYTTVSYAALIPALASAKLASADGDAAQSEVDSALTALNSALNGLVALGDKTGLKTLLDNKKDESKYEAAGYIAYLTAYDAAQAVYDDPQADQAAVDTAVGELTAAEEALILKSADKSGNKDKSGCKNAAAISAVLCALLPLLIIAKKRK